MLWRSLTRHIHAKRMKTWSTFLCASSENILQRVVNFYWNRIVRLMVALNKPHTTDAICHTWSCARIDNNRREYWERKGAKDGVHVYVLRIFFRCALLLSSRIMMNTPKQNTYQVEQSPQYYVWSICGSCARIDNNRREYCERELRKDGVHACVLRIFFSLRSFIKFSIQKRLYIS